MQALSFYLALPFLYLISLLPFPLLYGLSDICYFLVYRVFGYRKNVVRKNLQRSFPEKNLSEIIKIEKVFFRNLTDIMLETIKCITISKKALHSKLSIVDNQILDKFIGKNIIVTAGHCGNYEYINLFMGSVSNTKQFPFYAKAVYKPLSNPYFERFFFKFRTKFGSILYPVKEAKKAFEAQTTLAPCSYFLINDQSAPPEKSYITTFLNQETAFFKGPETYSKLYDMPVLFMKIDKPKRGVYELSFREITDSPKSCPENEILEKHATLLEENIKADIPNWLWSHKRWKYKKVNGEYVGVNYH